MPNRPKRWPKASYDPHYDPVVDAGPGHNRDYAPTYWIGTAGPAPEDDGPISEDTDVSNSQTIRGNNRNISRPLTRCRIETQPAGGRR